LDGEILVVDGDGVQACSRKGVGSELARDKIAWESKWGGAGRSFPRLSGRHFWAQTSQRWRSVRASYWVGTRELVNMRYDIE